MDPDKPDTQAPADPFSVIQTGRIAVLENIRGYRAAGGSWLEVIAAQAAVFVATFLARGEDDGG